MELIADILLGGGAIGAGLFCYVLSRRLVAFGTLEGGLGGAIAVLSAQVDDMTQALAAARGAAGDSSARLTELTRRAETAAQRLELLVAALHDLPAAEGTAHGSEPVAPQRQRLVRRSRRSHAPLAEELAV